MDTRFGRYRLLGRLAVGGMAEIFLAQQLGDEGFTKTVVLKRILPHLEADAEFVRMFIDEATLAAQLSHPNIVQVHDFGRADGSHYIVMEYIEGLDLHRLQQIWASMGRRLGAAEVAAIGAWVARALAFTHARTDATGDALGIVHRDVSPHNIMISITGGAKVLDFGIAKAAARRSRTATGAGTVKGKLAYMSPEQARGLAASAASDQFSLGAVLWEALAGRRLYSADSDAQLMQEALTGAFPRLAEAAPHVPVALAAIVERALELDPAARYASLEEMAQALEDFRFGMGKAGQVSLGPQVAEALAALADPARHENWSWRQAQPAPVGTRRLEGLVAPAAASPAEPRSFIQQPTPSDAAAAFLLARPTARISDPGPRPTQRVRRRPTRDATRPRLPRPLRMAAKALASAALPALLWWHAPARLAHAGPNPAAAQVDRPSDAPGAAAVTAPAAAAPGHLSLSCAHGRWRVYLGGRQLGLTPLRDVEVPAGPLALRLVDDAYGQWQSVQIFVPPGGELEEHLR